MGCIYNALREAAERYPENQYIIEAGAANERSASYRDILRAADQLAGYLYSQKISVGSRVVILAESRLEWMITFMAANRLDCIVVPLDPQNTEDAWTLATSLTNPAVIVLSSAFLKSSQRLQQASVNFKAGLYLGDSPPEELPGWISYDHGLKVGAMESPNVPRRDDALDVAMIIFTSGTAGASLAVELSGTALLENGSAMREEVAKTAQGKAGEIFLCLPPMNHVLGINALLGMIKSGWTALIFPKPDPKIIQESLTKFKPHFILAVPAFYERLASKIKASLELETPKIIVRLLDHFMKKVPLNNPRGYKVRKLLFRRLHKRLGGHIRGMVSGGSALDIETNRLFHFFGLPLYEGYGLTECTGALTTNRPKRNHIGTVGQVIHQKMKMKICDTGDTGIGELCLKGPLVMKGYYRNEEANRLMFDEEGWFHTGDLVFADEQGYFSFVGRKKDMIVTANGKNIYPEELEKHFSHLNKVKELCVVGLPLGNGKKGEKVHIQIVIEEEAVRRQGSKAVQDEIRHQLNELSGPLAFYKRPTSVGFSLESLPRTSTLKVKKHEVLASIGAPRMNSQVWNESSQVVPLSGQEKQVIKIIQGTLKTQQEVMPDYHLAMDLGLDSLAMMELWHELEQEFDVSISEKQLEDWRSVEDVIRCVLNATKRTAFVKKHVAA